MLHLVSALGFLLVACAAAALLWHMLAERADAIVAALRMAEPIPPLPAAARRGRVTVAVSTPVAMAAWQRRAA